MSKLTTMVSMECRMDLKTKSFWISTFLVPVLIVLFGIFIGYMTEQSDAMKAVGESTSHADNLSGIQTLGMVCGVFLTMFVMMYGAQIFNKVKTEKCNRIVEVLISSVSGKSVMLAKVISVAIVGLIQMLIWALLVVGILIFVYLMFSPEGMDFTKLLSWPVIGGLLLAILYFTGGFVFYGALFAAAGALTDRNNENQGYLSLLMMLLMVSFYVGIFATDAQDSTLATVCFYLPLTSTTVGAVQSVAGIATWWQTLLSLLTLFVSAYLALVVAGKIYTSAVLLKGKKFSIKDIVTFLRVK